MFEQEWLEYAVTQTHPLVKSWYAPDSLRENWRADLQRDTEEFFTDVFAQSFAGNCAVLGLPAEQFKHRVLETSTHRLIAGIRFFGMDISRPFVQVAQISKPLESDDERDEVTKLLLGEFSMFKPTQWRIYQSSHLEYQFLDCESDKRYLVGHLQDIIALPQPETIDRVHLELAKNLEFYPGYAMYQTLFAERPWMPDVSRQESLADMQEYVTNGWLYEIFIDDVWAGVTAASPGFEVGAKGQYMIEIALEKSFRGQGLSVALQRKLVALLAKKSDDPSLALFGTIGAVNLPMIKTATRVGRVDVGGNYWVKF